MTQHKEDTIIRSVFEIINENGIEGIGEAVSISMIFPLGFTKK